MKVKKSYIILMLIIIVLVISIISMVIILKDKSSKQVDVAMKFIKNLEKYEAIDIEDLPTADEYEEINNMNNVNSVVKYTVVTDEFGIDLDENFKVIGFLSKYNPFIDGEDIKEDIAIKKAREYLQKILDYDCRLSYVKDKSDETKNNYILVFNKYHNNYKCYSNEIVVGINRYTGLLSSFIGSNEVDNYTGEVKIDRVNVSNIAKDYLKEYNILDIKESDVGIGYYMIKPNLNKLVYVVDVEISKDTENKKNVQVIIDAEDGSIISNTL